MSAASYQTGGKFILLGEHFVVHGTPALAVPLRGVTCTVEVEAGEPGAGHTLETDVEGAARSLAAKLVRCAVAQLADPIRAATGLEPGPQRVRVRSTIPIGYGLGSSAAFSTALLGALAARHGLAMSRPQLNAASHELERLVHGQPSGIDDTVISLARPLRFMRGYGFEAVRPSGPLSFVLGSCHYPGSTRAAVAGVRELSEREPERFASLRADAIRLVDAGIDAFVAADAPRLGEMMDTNHELLQAVGVSTPDLDALVVAARGAGALGAKLTGAGRGGFTVALAPPGAEEAIAAALGAAGAKYVIRTTEGGERP